MTTGNYVEEFAAFLGWDVDSRELQAFNSQVKSVFTDVAKLGAIVAGAAIGITAYAVRVNKATFESANLAASFNLSGRELDNWGMVLDNVGITSEKTAKIIKTFNERLGGIKAGTVESTTLKKATDALGLSMKDLIEASPEQQFRMVAQAAKDTTDQQVAMAAAQQLLGREGSKAVGFLRTQAGTIDEIMGAQDRLNYFTDEGRAAAMRFGNALDTLADPLKTIQQEFFSLIGGGLSPMVEAMNEWIGANKELIQQEIRKWADRVSRALVWFFAKVKNGISAIRDFVDRLGGLDKVLNLVGLALGFAFTATIVSRILQLVAAFKKVGTAALLMQAKILLIPAAIAALALLFYLLGEDLYQFFTGGESALGKIGDKIAEFAQREVTPIIASMFGMTADEFNVAMVRMISDTENFFSKAASAIYNALPAWESFSNVLQLIWDLLKNFMTFPVTLWKTIGGFIKNNAPSGPGPGGPGFGNPYGLPPSGLPTPSPSVQNSTTQNSSKTTTVQAPVSINVFGAGDPMSIANNVNNKVGAGITGAVNKSRRER